jgi:hypothetical protein
MSYNGAGTFLINSAGQPVVAGTTISETVFNALTADLATGLSTAITKDGQTTPTANLPMGGFKLTGMAAGSAATDSARLGQVQGGTGTLITAAGTDTVTGTVTPTLTAYVAGQRFSFVAAGTNTTSMTLNIDSLGAKAITRAGSTALVAGDITSGELVTVVYDGTRFQTDSSNSFNSLNVANLFKVSTSNTGSSRLGLVEIVDGTWAPSSTTGNYYNRYFSIELTSSLSPRGTVSQLWNTQNVMISRVVSTSAAMANSHTIMDLAYCTIPVGVGVGDGGVLAGTPPLPVNADYQEIGGYAYNAIILTAGHYNEGIASYFYDNTGGVGVAAKSSNFLSVMVKNAASNLYLTYGVQAYSAGTQQATYAPTAAFRADGGWLAGLDLTGQSAGNYGIDLNGNGATAAIRLPYNKSIVSRDSGDANDVPLMSLAGTSIYLGAGSALTTAIFANSSATFAPAADNTISCGLGGASPLRWTAVWAVNGTIQTSDPSLKTNIQPLPDALPLVAAIDPVTFTWIEGGKEYQEVWEEQTVQATEVQSYEDTEISMIDGVAVQRTLTKTREALLWDDHPVIDEEGNPVLLRLQNGKDEDGNPIFRMTPKTYQTPVMVTKMVAVQKLVGKPGKRTHWGFLANNVQKVMEGTGRDFGGYVEDEAGTKHLRPDQLVPILWKAVQELSQQIAALKARS